MRIAICDKDKGCAEKTKKMIYDYANERRLDLLVEIYDSSEALLRSVNDYLLIILDYHINLKPRSTCEPTTAAARLFF